MNLLARVDWNARPLVKQIKTRHAAALGMFLQCSFACATQAAESPREAKPLPRAAPSIVYEIETGHRPAATELRRAVRTLIAATLKKPLSEKGRTVALKVGEGTSVALAGELASLAGGNVLLWDRTRAALLAGGFLRPDGTPALESVGAVRWLKNSSAYDARAAFFAPQPGRLIWGDREFETGLGLDHLSNISHLASIAAADNVRIIVATVPRAAPGIGIQGAVGSLLLDNLDNRRRFYTAGGAEGLLDLLNASGLRSKLQVALLDARVVQIAGGPGRNAIYERRLGKLLASADPIALDSHAIELIAPLAVQEMLPSPVDAARMWLRPKGSAAAPRYIVEPLVLQ